MPTRTRSQLTHEMRGYLESRDDVDQLRWTGDAGTYNVDRARRRPAAGVARRRRQAAHAGLGAGHSSSAATLIRLERTDRTEHGTTHGPRYDVVRAW